MMKRGILIVYFFVGFLLAVQTMGWAGVVFHTETTFPNRREMPPQAGSMMMEGDKLKMTMDGSEKQSPTIIYRGDRKEMLLINHADHTWRAMDQEALRNLSQQINPAMEQMQKRMEEALKNMPPERRVMMEKMLAGQGLDMGKGSGMFGGKVDVQIKQTGEIQMINGYPTEKYEIWQEGQKVAEHWVTDWKHIPGVQGGKRVFQDMAKFSRGAWQGAFKGGGGPASFIDAYGKMEGFPILTKVFSDGEVIAESKLTGVEEKQVPAQEFEPPKDYVKKEFLPKQAPSPAGQ